MRPISKSTKLLLGLSAVTGVATFYYLNDSQNKKAHAYFNSHYEPTPSSKWDDNWDCRSPHALTNPRLEKFGKINRSDDDKLLSNAMGGGDVTNNNRNKSTAFRNIILIRHGQYNLAGKTDAERTLTKLGQMQAGHTGKRLKELAYPYTDLVISTMSRAQETGHIISASLPNVSISSCDFLREGAPIPPEPPNKRWRPELHQFYQDGARIEAAFRKYFYRAPPEQNYDSYTILVCHANVIRYFVCRALQIPPEAWLRMSLNHASITWISISPKGKCVLRCLGDSGHMPPENISSH